MANYREPQWLLPNEKNLAMPASDATVGSGLAEDRQSLYSMEFDGVDDFIDTGDIMSFGTGDFSVSMWIKGTDTSSAYYLGSDTSPVTSTGFAIGRHSAIPSSYLGSPRVWVAGSSINGTTNVNDGSWHNVVVTRESGGVRIYVDGSEEVLHDNSNNPVASPYTMNSSVSTTKTIIGGLTSTTELWQGNIDEVAIWNKALSASEVSALATTDNAPANLMALDEDNRPVAYWPLGEQARLGSEWQFPNEVLQSQVINFDGTDEIEIPETTLSDEFSISVW